MAMTKEEFRDALVIIAKQAYWEGRRTSFGDDYTIFEDTTIYKQIMGKFDKSNVVVNRIKKEML